MRAFHLSFNAKLGPTLSPKLPAGTGEVSGPYPEPLQNRICFSTTVIGCFYAIYPNISQYFEEHNYPHMDMYLYEAELDETSDKFVSTKTLTKDKMVWDAHVTREVWWLDSVQIKLNRKIRITNPGETTKDKEVWGHPFDDNKLPAKFIAPIVSWSTLEHFQKPKAAGLNSIGHHPASNTRQPTMRAFHLTLDDRLGPLLHPRLPSDALNFVKVTSEPPVRRVCFSRTIIGCFYAVYPSIAKQFEEDNEPYIDMYLYETMLDETSDKFVPTTTLTSDRYVSDAHVTQEVWWLDRIMVSKARKIRIMNPREKRTKQREVWAWPFNDSSLEPVFIAPWVSWVTLEQWGEDKDYHVYERILPNQKPLMHPKETASNVFGQMLDAEKNSERLRALQARRNPSAEPGIEDFDSAWDRKFVDLSAGLEDFGAHAPSIKEIFDRHLKHLTIDDKLGKKLQAEMYAFINKNDEHIRFFGGNLTGTYRIKFTSTDKNEILIHMLDIDADAIRQEVLKVPGVNSDWIISTDIFNMTMQYLVHCFYNTDIPTKKKMDAMIAVLMLLHFKLLGSILHQFFPYRVDERLAMATYAAMSMKFALKRLGTWYKAIDERCHDVIAHDSPHITTIKRFNETEAIRYMIQDIQNRMRIRAKKIHATMRMVIDQDKRMQTVSGTVTLDGEVIVREITRTSAEYSKYLNRIVLSEREFIKEELIVVIAAEMKSMPEVPLEDTLKAVVGRAVKRDKQFEELKTLMLAHLFEEMTHNPDLARAMKDPALFLNKLKYLYQSSKTTDPDVLRMRDLATKIVIKSVKIRTAATIASIRTGLQLYIVLRMLTQKKYG